MSVQLPAALARYIDTDSRKAAIANLHLVSQDYISQLAESVRDDGVHWAVLERHLGQASHGEAAAILTALALVRDEPIEPSTISRALDNTGSTLGAVLLTVLP